jgi:transposase
MAAFASESNRILAGALGNGDALQRDRQARTVHHGEHAGEPAIFLAEEPAPRAAAVAVVIRKRISRAKLLEFFAALSPCLVGIEACPTAHYWSRRLQALGHRVRLLPPNYVKAYLSAAKTMLTTLPQSARRSRGRRCDLWRRSLSSSSRA